MKHALNYCYHLLTNIAPNSMQLRVVIRGVPWTMGKSPKHVQQLSIKSLNPMRHRNVSRPGLELNSNCTATTPWPSWTNLLEIDPLLTSPRCNLNHQKHNASNHQNLHACKQICSRKPTWPTEPVDNEHTLDQKQCCAIFMDERANEQLPTTYCTMMRASKLLLRLVSDCLSQIVMRDAPRNLMMWTKTIWNATGTCNNNTGYPTLDHVYLKRKKYVHES